MSVPYMKTGGYDTGSSLDSEDDGSSDGSSDDDSLSDELDDDDSEDDDDELEDELEDSELEDDDGSCWYSVTETVVGSIAPPVYQVDVPVKVFGTDAYVVL